MSHIDVALLDRFRAAHQCCEACGAPGTIHVHHLFSRGAGRVDHEHNIVALCATCHTQRHDGNNPSFEELARIISQREGVPVWKLTHTVYMLRRRDHDPDFRRGVEAVFDDPLGG